MTRCVPAMSHTPVAREFVTQSPATPRVWPGHPLALGVTQTHRGLNFAVFSRHATAIWLVLFAPDDGAASVEIALDPAVHRTGDIWHIEVEGIDGVTRYAWRADGPSNAWHRFDR